MVPAFFEGLWVEELDAFFLFAEGLAAEDGHGVVAAEEVGIEGAVALVDEFAGLAHAGGTAFGAVGVGGDDMDPTVAEHFVGEALGFGAHVPGDGSRGDLGEETVAEPGKHAFGFALEDGVAFRVGEDGDEAGLAELEESFLEAGGEGVFGEFDEEVIEAVDGVTGGVGQGVLDVVVAEVEVAAQTEGKGDACLGEGDAEFGGACLDEGGIEGIAAAGVGGGDDVGDAVGNGDLGHLEGGGEVRRTVVQPWQKMVVYVDHPVKGTIGRDDLCGLRRVQTGKRAT